MGCALTHVKKYARCAQSAVIPVNGEAERHDGWLPPSVSGGRRQPEAVCGGQAAHGATRLHSARQRDVVRVLSHDWQACRHLLERCVKNQPSLVEKGVVCPCTGVWGVVLSCWTRNNGGAVLPVGETRRSADFYVSADLTRTSERRLQAEKKLRFEELNHAFFGPGTTVEPFCRLEKLGDRPIFTCLQT